MRGLPQGQHILDFCLNFQACFQDDQTGVYSYLKGFIASKQLPARAHIVKPFE